MLDLSDLGRFMAASQASSLGRAAEGLGIAPSSLSGRLKALEGELGFTLFERARRGLVPNASARWLFRESLNILHGEAFARRVLDAGAAPPHAIFVDINIGFTIGRLAKAVAIAVEAAARAAPGACFTVRWRDGKRPGRTAKGSDRTAQGRTVCLHYQLGPEASVNSRLVVNDPFSLIHSRPGREIGEGVLSHIGPVTIPKIQGVPPRWLRKRLSADAVSGYPDVSFVDDEVGRLEDLIFGNPETNLLVPSSALSSRLRAQGVSVRRLNSDLALPIVATFDGCDPAVAAFLQSLRAALAAPETAFLAKPEITIRQFDYFNLLCRTQSVTGAAKLAGVAQPAITEQIGKLEATVSGPLFERSRHGVTLTPAGHRFEAAAAMLTAARHEIAVKRPQDTNHAGDRLELGILPSVGPSSFLIARVARAVEAWRLRYPKLRLRILEQPNVTLQERVRRGTLDLGIITTRSPRMARFDLGSSEALALITNPAFGLVPTGTSVDFDALARLPLVLPTAQFGLRQLIDTAGHSRGITLKPAIEVDSLSMCLALVRESPLGTILPPSDIIPQAEAGELSAHPIQKPKIIRTLQIIYSADRMLTEAERELVRLLRFHLAATERSA